MTLLTGWPTITDDSGNGTSGTIITKTGVWDVIKSAIETLIHSTTNPTVTPEDIIDEVVAARGNLGSLNTRLSGVVDADGNPIAAAGTATQDQVKAQLAALNLAVNADLSSWSGGGSAAPDSFTLSGAGATIARTGAAMSDTFTFGAGPYAAKITRAAPDADLTQTIIAGADWSKYEKVEGRKVVVGAWVKTSIASHARLVISDGATESNSSYHTGGGSGEFLTVLHTIWSSATKLEFRCEVNSSSGDAYFGGFIFLFSDLVPSAWQYGSNISIATATLNGLVSTSAQDLGDGVKNFGDPPTFYPGTQAVNKATIGGSLTVNTSDVAMTGTTETDLMTYTLESNTLSANGKVVRVMAAFLLTNTAGNKIIAFYLGSSSLQVYTGTQQNVRVIVVVDIVRTGSATQKVYAQITNAYFTGTPQGAANGSTGFTADLTTDLTLKFTGDGAGASDGVTQEYMSVEEIG